MKNLFKSKLTKFVLCLVLIVANIVLPMFSESTSGFNLATYAYADNYNITYYPKCKSSYTSLVDALKSVGAPSSYSQRKSIATLNGIQNYSGTAAQNKTLLNLLKQGKLIKSKTKVASAPANDWEIQIPSSASVKVSGVTTVTVKFKGTGISSVNIGLNKSNVISASSSTSWKSAGQWCTTTITISGKAAGTVTLSFSLSGSRSMTKSMTITVSGCSSYQSSSTDTTKTVYVKASSLEEWVKNVQAQEGSLVGYGSLRTIANGNQVYYGNIITRREILSYQKVTVTVPNGQGPNVGFKKMYINVPYAIRYTIHKHNYSSRVNSQTAGTFIAGLVSGKVLWTQQCSCGSSYILSWEIPDLSYQKITSGQTYTVTTTSRMVD